MNYCAWTHIQHRFCVVVCLLLHGKIKFYCTLPIAILLPLCIPLPQSGGCVVVIWERPSMKAPSLTWLYFMTVQPFWVR